MKRFLAVILAAALLPAFAPAVQAQSLDELFRKVSSAVVVVRSKGGRAPRQDGGPGFDGVEHGPAGGDRVVTIGGKEIALGGDIIPSADGISVVSEDNIEMIRNRLAGTAPGTTFKMSVLRAGTIVELTGTSQ